MRLRHCYRTALADRVSVSHIGGAIVVAITLGAAAISTLRRYAGVQYLTRPATLALMLVGVQILLGLSAYITRSMSPNDPQPLNPMIGITVAHVACGALVFATTIVLTLRTFQVLRVSQSVGELATV